MGTLATKTLKLLPVIVIHNFTDFSNQKWLKTII